jgi:tetratricopeptide (TPR) repeat protein
MRRLILIAALVLPAPVQAEIGSAEECTAAVAADPATAREDAAIWSRMGGGVPARLCEATALEAMGATATAAQLLSGLAANPNRAMNADLRGIVFADAARLWLDAGKPDLAAEAIVQADRLAPPDPSRRILRARIEAARQDWTAALATLDAAVAESPDDAEARALHAAALRHSGKAEAARAEADHARALDPDLPAALFEAAAARAELGATDAARQLFLDLIEAYPDSELAEPARKTLHKLN